MKNTNLVNIKDMIGRAKLFNYAVAQININNLEWTKWTLEAAQQTNSPIILGVSEGAVKYMGGYSVVYSMVNSLICDLGLTIPVSLHLDHGTKDGCIKALEAGFPSVMFDGSRNSFESNLADTSEMIKLCKKYNASLEVELGGIPGTEDNFYSEGLYANLDECITMGNLHIDALAINFGSIHGLYPKDWKGLDFNLLVDINSNVNKPFVLHGGTGIPDDQIQKAISLGVSKININTELQIAFTRKMREYFVSGKDMDLKSKSYDPRKIFGTIEPIFKKICIEKFKLFASFGTAK